MVVFRCGVCERWQIVASRIGAVSHFDDASFMLHLLSTGFGFLVATSMFTVLLAESKIVG